MADVAGGARHELVAAARLRAELTVSELWLRYVALGGDRDLFDIDGYLAGLLPLSTFDENALAVAVNERLEEIYRAARVPLAAQPLDPAAAGALEQVVAVLLDHRPAPGPSAGDSTGAPDPPSAQSDEPDGAT